MRNTMVKIQSLLEPRVPQAANALPALLGRRTAELHVALSGVLRCLAAAAEKPE